MVTAFREELHADGNLGAAVRYHSYWGQYNLTDCATGEQGSMTVGGHMDYARLTVGPNHQVVPLAGDPAPSCGLSGDSRQEGRLGDVEQGASVWYGATNRPSAEGQSPPCDDAYGFGPHIAVVLNVGTQNWGPVDPSDPSALHFYADRDKHHGTTVGTDALTIWIGGFPTDANGKVNFQGHVDRHGAVVPEVAGKAEGSDYIPLVIKNAKLRAYGANGPQPGKGSLQAQPIGYDGDVLGPKGEPGFYVQTPKAP
jgi:hypothetical protein